MGSRSKNSNKRFRQKLTDEGGAVLLDFYSQVLANIEKAESGELLSWSERARLCTRFRSRLPDFCQRHGLGVADGYIETIQRLVSGDRLEFFERDALDRIKKLLRTIVGATQGIRDGSAQAYADFLERL